MILKHPAAHTCAWITGNGALSKTEATPAKRDDWYALLLAVSDVQYECDVSASWLAHTVNYITVQREKSVAEPLPTAESVMNLSKMYVIIQKN